VSSTVSGTIRALIGQQASRLRPHEHGLNTWATPQRCFGRSYKDSRLMAELLIVELPSCRSERSHRRGNARLVRVEELSTHMTESGTAADSGNLLKCIGHSRSAKNLNAPSLQK
jgi:hypothetical protein